MSNYVNRSLQRKLLEDLRSKLIGEHHTLPFTIYSDETIELLLQKQPKTLEELVQIKGFPKNGKRVKGFGEYVVRIFNDPEAIENATVTNTDDGLTVNVQFKNLNYF